MFGLCDVKVACHKTGCRIFQIDEEMEIPGIRDLFWVLSNTGSSLNRKGSLQFFKGAHWRLVLRQKKLEGAHMPEKGVTGINQGVDIGKNIH